MKLWIPGLLCLSLFACGTPAQRFNKQALAMGFAGEIVASQQFQHKIYKTDNLLDSDVLHVYLDGDGTPWERNRWIADDPTARNPLILQLMSQDDMPSILLGRPCYYGLNHEQGCDNKYWTSHRYSKKVVDSLVAVLNAWLDQHDFKKVVLIGYSGGGSLAMLMAENIKQVSKVVTIAANLDVAAWSQYHGYLPLNSSLNPAEEGVLNPDIQQIHFAGKDDEVVPAFIIMDFSSSQDNALYYEVERQDHACCWKEEWMNVLAKVKALEEQE